MRVDANAIEKLDRTLKGFNYLLENNEITVQSAEVEVEGEVYTIDRDYEIATDGEWVVEFS
jgi:hypothetical protein